MRNNIDIKILGLIFLLCVSFNTSIKAQKSCAIYDNILSFFNQEQMGMKFLYNPPFDSTTNFEGVLTPIEDKQLLNFLIVNKTNQFSNNSIKEWFAELMKDTTLTEINFTSKNDKDRIFKCHFNKCLKYEFVDFKRAVKFVDNDSFVEIQKSDTIYFNPAGVIFSDILYSSDNKLAVTYVKVNKGLGFNFLYGFLYERKNKRWVLKKSEKEVM